MPQHGTGMMIVVMGLICITLSIGAMTSAIDWDEPLRISYTGDGDSTYPEVSVEGDYVHVVYDSLVSGGDDYVQYNRSVDGGVTWSSQVLSIDGNSPKVASDSGYVHVVFTTLGGINYTLHYIRSVDNGRSWESEVDLGVQAAYEGQHSIAANDGYVYIAYISTDNNLSLLRSPDRGGGWEAPYQISTAPTLVSDPQISAWGQYVHVAFQEDMVNDVYYTRSTQHGATDTWDPRIKMFDAAESLALHSHRTCVAVASSLATGLAVRVSTSYGANWSSALPVTTNIDTDVDATWSEDGDLHLVWRGRDQGDMIERLFYSSSTDVGQNFSLEVEIASTPENRSLHGPSIGHGNRTVHMAWWDTRHVGDDAGKGKFYANEIYHIRSIDETPPDPPFVSSETHPVGVWISSGQPTFTWDVPVDDSGIDGFSCALDQSPDTEPIDTINCPINTTSYTGIADGVWYFHVRATDMAGNWGEAAHYEIKIDATPPGVPSTSSPTHAEAEWTSLSDVTVEWTEPPDTSGIAGYSYILDGSPDTDPSGSVDTTGTDALFMSLVEGVHYFHIRAMDEAGNLGVSGHYAIWVDTTSPSPPDISSSTHVEGTWTSSDAPVFVWTEPSDVSGIAGYSYVLDEVANTVPGTSTMVNGTTVSIANVSDGTWYFHLRALDGAGNWGGSTHYEIRIDTVPPPSPMITSPTHVENRRTGRDDPEFLWDALDDASGIAGYSLVLDQNPDTEPTAVVTLTGTNVSFQDQSDGTWFLHLRAMDNAGNWGPADHYAILIGELSDILDEPPDGSWEFIVVLIVWSGVILTTFARLRDRLNLSMNQLKGVSATLISTAALIGGLYLAWEYLDAVDELLTRIDKLLQTIYSILNTLILIIGLLKGNKKSDDDEKGSPPEITGPSTVKTPTPEEPEEGRRYLLNTSSGQVHDLKKKKPECLVDHIKLHHRKYYVDLEELKKEFEPCNYCLGKDWDDVER